MDDVKPVIETNTVTDRVARGARLLDELRPGWASLVDLDILAMRRCDRCILGQVFGAYSAGLEVVFTSEEIEDDREIDYGFEYDLYTAGRWSDPAAEYAELAAAWRDEVRARTGGGA